MDPAMQPFQGWGCTWDHAPRVARRAGLRDAIPLGLAGLRDAVLLGLAGVRGAVLSGLAGLCCISRSFCTDGGVAGQLRKKGFDKSCGML